MKEKINYYIKKHDIKGCESLYLSLGENERMSKTMTAFSIILRIARIEEDNGIKGLFWRKGCESIDELVQLYYRVKYYLRRVEYDIEPEVENELITLNISKYMLLMMISLFTINKGKVSLFLMKGYKKVGDKEKEQVLLKFMGEAKVMNGETHNG